MPRPRGAYLPKPPIVAAETLQYAAGPAGSAAVRGWLGSAILMQVPQLRAWLSQPSTYPGSPTPVEVHETHISWVFLAGERAYKLKKPVALAFVDYSTPERRRHMCAEEVRLNRRHADGVYLGVRGIAADGPSFRFVPEDDPAALDYVVEMRRFDEGQTLAGRVEHGTAGDRDIAEVAGRLVRFHAAAEPVAPTSPPVLVAERSYERNVHELLATVEQTEPIGRVLALERFAHAFIAAQGSTLAQRARRGLIRDCHGDVRADHVVFRSGVQLVDCVEFDRELRALDVADDLAFLVLDLVARGAHEAARRLVAEYRAAGGDAGEDTLIAFYASYRALVRAKVALVRHGQHGSELLEREAVELIELAERFAWRARMPLVLVVCGVPASGKSHLARALAQRAGLPHLSSDATRKQLLGLRGGQGAPQQAYEPDVNTRTYAALGSAAAAAVGHGAGAVVDGTFRHLADRQHFTAAFARAAPILFVESRVPRAVLERRAAERDSGEQRLSDATLAVVCQESSIWDPLDEVDPDRHLTIRADRATDALLDDLAIAVDRRLPSLARQ